MGSRNRRSSLIQDVNRQFGPDRCKLHDSIDIGLRPLGDMNPSEILRIVDAIHRDKNIDKEIVFQAIESALVSAARKNYGDEADIVIQIDRDRRLDSGNLQRRALGSGGDGRPHRGSDRQAGHHSEDSRGGAGRAVRRVSRTDGPDGRRCRAAQRRSGDHRVAGQHRGDPAARANRFPARRITPTNACGPRCSTSAKKAVASR